MSAADWATPGYLNEYVRRQEARNAAKTRLQSTLTPEVAQYAAEIYRSSPWLQPGVVMSLARANASESTVRRIASTAATSALMRGEDDDKKKKDKPWYMDVAGAIVDNPATRFVAKAASPDSTAAALGFIGGGIGKIVNNPITNNPATRAVGRAVGSGLEWATPDIVKPISRWGVAAAMSVKELIDSSPRWVTGQQVGNEQGDERGRAGWGASTTFGTMLGGVDPGSGYFPGEAVREEQAERARRYRGTINGAAFTAGRGYAAVLNLEPGTTMHNLVSGIIDGAMAAKFDLLNAIPVDEIKDVTRAARGTERAIVGVDTYQDLVLAAFKAGGQDAQLAGEKFMELVQKNRYIRQFIQKMADAENPYDVMELFRDRRSGEYRLAIDDAIAIANAKTVDEQIGFMAQLFGRRRLTPEELAAGVGEGITQGEAYVVRTAPGALGEDVSRLQGARGAARFMPETQQKIRGQIEEAKLYQWAQRWATEAPRSLLAVRGSTAQRMEAVRNYANWLKSMKVFDETNLDYVKRKQATTAVALKEAAIRLANSLPDGADWDALQAGIDEIQSLYDNLAADATPAQVRSIKTRIKSLGAGINGSVAMLGEPSAPFMQKMDALVKLLDDAPDNLARTRRAELASRFLYSMSDEYGSAQGAYNSKTVLLGAIRDTLEANGFTDEVIDGILKKIEDNENIIKQYWITQTGSAGGRGYLKGLVEAGVIDAKDVKKILKNPNDIDYASIVSPTVMGDLLNNAIILPDFREIRFKQNPFWARSLQGSGKVGELGVQSLGAASEATDYVTNRIWKRLALATGGYIFRNMLDAQLRAALVGKRGGFSSIFTSPMDYIQWSIMRRGAVGIDGEDFDDLAKWYAQNKDADVLEGAAGEFIENLSRASANVNLSLDERMDRLTRTGEPIIMTFDGNRESYTTGIVDMMGRVNSELSTRLALDNLDADEAFAVVSSDAATVRELKSLWKSGMTVSTKDGRYVRIPVQDVDAEFRELFNIWYREAVAERAQMFMANPELKIAARFGYAPRAGAKPTNYPVSDVEDMFGAALDNAEMSLADLKVGDVIPYSQMGEGMSDYLIVGRKNVVILDPNGQKIGEMPQYFRIVEVDPVPAFAGEAGKGSFRLREIIQDSAARGDLPRQSLYFRREQVGEEFGKLESGVRMATDWFFDLLNPAVTRKLEKSPFWRMQYYDIVADNVDLLSPVEAQRVLDNIAQGANEAGVSVLRYLGGTRVNSKPKKMLEDLRAQTQKTPGEALPGTAADLSEYAGRLANHRLKGMFYDAVNRRNYEDALRYVLPFGGAWRDLLTKWVDLVADDPRRIRKVQLVYTGAENADPDGDGRGWIYKDPVTGRKMFAFPGSETIGKLLTGLNVGLEAPVQRLNVSFQTLPGFGPFIQIPVAQVLRGKPEWSWFANVVAPYGTNPNTLEAFAGAFVPNWIKKAHATWFGNPDDVNSKFAINYIDTLRALSTNGQYDLADPDDVDKLFRDAEQKARIVLAMETASAFFGPTSGTATYRVTTEDGIDVYADTLAKEFARMRSENYEDAVGEFLSMYGDDFLLYVASKTVVTEQGYEPTKKFLDWQVKNADFLDRHSNVGAYFGPSGDDFSFFAWIFQNEAGILERRSDRGLVEAAQYVAGNSEYRAFRNEVLGITGGRTNENITQMLREKREEIHSRLPGFPVDAEFTVNKLKNFIVDLEEAIADPRVADTPLAKDIGQYLAIREEIVTLAGGNLGGVRRAGARALLAQKAEEIAERNPDFRRLYDRQLAAETESN